MEYKIKHRNEKKTQKKCSFTEKESASAKTAKKKNKNE